MHILFLTQILPYPLDAGPKVRAYYVLRYLAQRHRVTLLTFIRPDDPPEAAGHLREFCAAVHTVPMHRSRLRDVRSLVGSLLTGQSFIIRRDHVPAMAHKVDGLLATEEFDAVHADQLWMTQYALRAVGEQGDGETGRQGEREAERQGYKDTGIQGYKDTRIQGDKETRGGRPGLVLDEHNACYLIFQRLARGERNPLKRALLEREWRALARYEAWVCGQFDRVVTVTDEDQEALRRRMSESANQRSTSCYPQFTTIPICIDSVEVPAVEPTPGARDVLHLGTMFFLPNVEGVLWFAREVWPRVAAQVPGATFTVVGKNPPAAVRRLTRNTQYATRNTQCAIRVAGYVPDPAPYLRQAAVFIVPLRSGGGMRVKILDAWRWGLPIVSTGIGAEGIDHRNGENILIAADVESFARAVVRVLQEPGLAQRLRENGRRWVEARYDWRQVYRAWDEVYLNLKNLNERDD